MYTYSNVLEGCLRFEKTEQCNKNERKRESLFTYKLSFVLLSMQALALGPRAVSTEMCPPDSDPCNKEISGKIRKSNNIPQPCPI